MGFDLRFFVGLLFTLIGIVLTAFGYATNGNAAMYARSLGINVNLWWGLTLLVLGQIIFQIGRRAQLRMTEPKPAKPDAKKLRRGK